MIISHPLRGKKECWTRRTVHGDGDGLAEDEAVSTLEGGDLAELVELQVLGGDTIGRDSLDELEVKTVLLRDGEQRGGARVALRDTLVICSHFIQLHPGSTNRVGVELAERHDCGFLGLQEKTISG